MWQNAGAGDHKLADLPPYQAHMPDSEILNQLQTLKIAMPGMKLPQGGASGTPD